jgi:DNA topoisomerase-1
MANSSTSVSDAHIPKSVDKAMDKASSSAKNAPAGVSIRNGPVLEDKMEIDGAINGTSKRKSRTSTSKAVNYNIQGSDSDEDSVPLV